MILLRPATLADAELLRTWRNDADMRKNSFHSSVVGAKAHKCWLFASLRSKRRQLYIAEAPGRTIADRWEAVGTGRLDFDGITVELSLEVAPEHRGLGHGGHIVVALIAKAHEWKPGAPLIAHVKAFNTPSLRAFLRAGFAVKGQRCLRLEMR